MLEIIVGNIGSVYSGDNWNTAEKTYEEYVGKSVANDGRAAGEDVTWFVDGRIFHEHLGTMRKTRTVDVSLNEIIDSDYLDGFLDVLEELFFAEDSEEDRGILDDIVFKPVSVTAEGMIRIEVTATIEPF